ncbi:MAG: nucleoside triphosphate pyrophosphohydrolase [Bacteroidales bacterium]|nr:nucleoside triphosphate pyrophosphohydrolase [Candidatus Minthousia equi]
MHTREEKLEAFGRLLDVMDELRVKCPWDRKQTNQSLRANTIEETYELCEALMNEDRKNICKELGDVLLHIVFYAKIGSETNDFDIKDVCDQLCDKLIFRHPHVFGEVQADTAEKVLQNWEQIKQKEKDGNKTVLSGVPSALPSLIKAFRVQEKASNVGFDWEHPEEVWDKVREEYNELQVELNDLKAQRKALEEQGLDAKSPEIQAIKLRSEQEFGDLLFSVVNAGRLYKINPDNALELTNQKFIRRFGYVEAYAKSQGKELKDLTLGEMDELWNQAKQQEKKG